MLSKLGLDIYTADEMYSLIFHAHTDSHNVFKDTHTDVVGRFEGWSRE